MENFKIGVMEKIQKQKLRSFENFNKQTITRTKKPNKWNKSIFDKDKILIQGYMFIISYVLDNKLFKCLPWASFQWLWKYVEIFYRLML